MITGFKDRGEAMRHALHQMMQDPKVAADGAVLRACRGLPGCEGRKIKAVRACKDCEVITLPPEGKA